VDRINPAEDDPAIGCCLPSHSLQLGEDGRVMFCLTGMPQKWHGLFVTCRMPTVQAGKWLCVSERRFSLVIGFLGSIVYSYILELSVGVTIYKHVLKVLQQIYRLSYVSSRVLWMLHQRTTALGSSQITLNNLALNSSHKNYSMQRRKFVAVSNNSLVSCGL
jgi:hypothetical protein